jgi:hypothetical protein
MSLVGFLNWMTKIKFLIGLVFVVLSFILGKIALPVFPINSDISLIIYLVSWVILIGGIAMCGKHGLYMSRSLYKKYGHQVIEWLKHPKNRGKSQHELSD